MGLFSALRRKSTDEDLYDEYEDDYVYDDEEDWDDQGLQPIHSVADMRVVVVEPQEYKDASRVADHLRDMKLVVLNLSKTEHDIMKIASSVFVVAPYFVDIKDLSGEGGRSGDLYF